VLWALIGASFATTLYIILRYPFYINHDSALFLTIGRRLLEGQLPYVDYIESNLPLIHYLHVLPVLVGRVFSINATPVFSLLVLGLTTVSVGLLYKSLRPIDDTVPLLALTTCVGHIAGLSFAILGGDYGQRGHLLLLFYLPAFALRSLRWQGISAPVWYALMIGTVAAVGVNIKPYYYIIATLPEVYWFASTRRFRNFFQPEMYAFATVTSIYGAILLLSQNVRSTYLMEVLPELLENYGAYGEITLIDQYGTLQLFHLETLLAVVFVVLPYKRLLAIPDEAARFMRGLGLLMVGSVISVLIQGKPYPYHKFPLRALLLMGIIIVAFNLTIYAKQQNVISHYAALGIQTLSLLKVTLFFALMVLFFRIHINDIGQLDFETFVETHTSESDGIIVISTIADPHRVLAWTDRRHIGKYIVSMPIAFAFKDETDGRAVIEQGLIPPQMEDYLAQVLVEIETEEPVLIALDNEEPCFACPPGMRIAEYLERIGFIDEITARGYEYAGQADQYWLYLRVEQ